MIHEVKAVVSRNQFAFAMNTFTITKRTPESAPPYYRWSIEAIWFRRRSGATRVSLGFVRESVRGERPADAYEAFQRSTDGRYGGWWEARWDGDNYVSEVPSTPAETEQRLAILRPALENYPNVPDGYAGWWRFETSSELRELRGAVR